MLKSKEYLKAHLHQDRTPLQQLNTLRNSIRGLRQILKQTAQRGSTAMLVEGIAAQANKHPMVLVVGTPEYGEKVGIEHRIKCVCLNHLEEAMQDNQSGLIFDNSALNIILANVEVVMGDVLNEAGAFAEPSADQQDGQPRKERNPVDDILAMLKSADVIETMDAKIDALKDELVIAA